MVALGAASLRYMSRILIPDVSAILNLGAYKGEIYSMNWRLLVTVVELVFCSHDPLRMLTGHYQSRLRVFFEQSEGLS